MMAFLHVSCDSETLLSEKDNTDETSLIPYSSEYIIARANYYYNMLPGQTRKGVPMVANIEKIEMNDTRGEENPTYYIVNYEAGAGFVMVGGNDKSDPVVAISDEGNLQLPDTVTNPALGEFISSLSFSPVLKDSNIFIHRPINPIYNSLSVAPLIPASVRKWGDGEPFNKYAPIINNTSGKRAKVGCVPVSCAMLMSYYKWPTIHEFVGYDWDAIINDQCNDNLCKLLKRIGSSNHLNMQYGEKESICDIEMIKMNHMLNDLYCGITTNHGSTLITFDVSSRQRILEQLPLLMWGDVIKNGELRTETWVIDGLLYVSPDDEKYIGIPSPSYFMHCVWGKYGVGNGYYKLTRLDAIGGSRFTIDGEDGVFDGITNDNEVGLHNNNSYLFKMIKVPNDSIII